METEKFYTLPRLSYGYKDLEPYISEQQLTIHHQKHHQAYVNGANAILEKLEKARKDNADLDMKSVLKELSFNVGGHLLHSLFWGNLASASRGRGVSKGILAGLIEKEFGSFERFRKEFSQAALSVEGSGWAALAFDKERSWPVIMQIEKHNANIYPTFEILMVLDVFEHAYYLDYKNERAKFIDAFWNIVNWDEVEKRRMSC
ncbi:MAG: superoxide dismutase [Candidatus Nealsonbacteria bacterium CG_4_10_14_0_2_um_filter_40_15]|uniref:Superoxide dismutase n=1 Tax=Candidatus Nealsonbacteria bacterium CG_4_10_14_0_2_um_filter_40_15 TaxID=1974682 RepID=A0A2M7UUX9_9BACT|nr:MAG: superoxide dismutase [Candidatus Nealsonbacteria bacterium CG_4_10_14_0_2_um_filter_40_15]